tara:strand:+ start:4 stop:1014 length:1011 start_codon:yes stop_codon:yes gene_type:complete
MSNTNNFLGKNSIFGINNSNSNSNVKKSSSKVDTKTLIVFISVLCIVVVFSGFMGYIYFKNYSQNKIQDYMEVELLENLHSCDNNPLVIAPAKIPASTIGNEYSLNFWIYVSDLQHFNKNPNHLGNVLTRGLDNGNQGKYYFYEGNPGIYMETGKNNLVFCFKPADNIMVEELDAPSGTDLVSLKEELAIRKIAELKAANNNKNNIQPHIEEIERQIDEYRKNIEEKYTFGGSNIAVVDNLPLQRWTCINVSVFNQNVDIYVDGKLKTARVLPKPPSPANNVPMILGPNGGFDGYLSRIKFSNKTLNQSDIYERYKEGPRITQGLGQMIKDTFSKN